MSIQSSIMSASSKVQRRLFDNNIHITGRAVEAIHFYVEEDKYGNEYYQMLKNKPIEATIRYPTEIPLDRVKGDSFEIRTSSNREFFFDVLPIDLFSKWDDKVEVGDYIIDFLYSEKEQKIPIILRVSEFLASFSTHLVWKKHYCSPFRGALPDPIRDFINTELNPDDGSGSGGAP